MKFDTRKLPARIILYLVAQVLNATGVVLTIKASIGVALGSGIPVVINTINPNITVGTVSTIFFAVLVLLQIIILRKDFRPIDLVQFFLALLYGKLVDLMMSLLSWITITSYPMRVVVLLLSIVLQGIGIAIYVTCRLIVMPPEGFCLSLGHLSEKIDLGKGRIILDTALLVITLALSLIFLKKIVAIREGSVILWLLTGHSINLFRKLIGRPLEKFLYGEHMDEAPAPEEIPAEPQEDK